MIPRMGVLLGRTCTNSVSPLHVHSTQLWNTGSHCCCSARPLRSTSLTFNDVEPRTRGIESVHRRDTIVFRERGVYGQCRHVTCCSSSSAAAGTASGVRSPSMESGGTPVRVAPARGDLKVSPGRRVELLDGGTGEELFARGYVCVCVFCFILLLLFS